MRHTVQAHRKDIEDLICLLHFSCFKKYPAKLPNEKDQSS